ncbi:MAG: DUF4384 domain-containing protein [Syntrophobacterales bacterium]
MNRWLLYVLISLVIAAPWKFTYAVEASNSTHSSMLSFEVNYVYRTAGVGELKTIQNGDTLTSGDHYKIVFTPDKDCFVYIFQVDSSGQAFQLFPMKSFRGVPVNQFNPVKQAKKYVLPSPDKAFVLDQKSGIERIYFVASIERNRELDSLYKDLKQPARGKKSSQSENPRSKLNKYFRRRGIKVVPSEQHMEVPWRETGDIFSVMSQRLENLSKERIHVLEFVHQ